MVDKVTAVSDEEIISRADPEVYYPPFIGFHYLRYVVIRMTYSRSRRRKRNAEEAAQDNISQPDSNITDDVTTSLKDPTGDSDLFDSQEDSELTEEQLRKKELWDVFREEFFEGTSPLKK